MHRNSRLVATSIIEKGTSNSSQRAAVSTIGNEAAHAPDISHDINHTFRSPYQFLSGSRLEWAVLGTIIFLAYAIDIFALKSHEQTTQQQFIALALWVFVAVAFGLFCWLFRGFAAASYWFTGYYLEWLLSIDNILAFSLIFKTYRVPAPLVHKALLYGMFGCLIFRYLMFATIGPVHHFLYFIRFLRFAFGVVLIYSGAQVMSDDVGVEPTPNTWSLRLTKAALGTRWLPHYDFMDHQPFLVHNGKTCATLLVHVMFCLEITDSLFALDSVSAKVAVIPDSFVAYSSTAMAVFGVRAMFYIVHSLVEHFEFFSYCVAFSLTFIGVQLVLGASGLKRFELPEWMVCVIIAFVFACCMVATFMSRYLKRRQMF